jgi:ComF family protein
MELCLTCLSQPPDWQECTSAVTYADPWRSLIIDFKFHENPGLAKFLSSMILNNPFARELVHAADVLVPVPAATQRLRERGFNPALCLAHAMAKDRCLDDALVKWRQTPPQSGLDRARRLSNLKHSITAHPLLAHQLKSRHVVLVDDVMTTGSTLHTCAQALFDAGVQRVSCVVLARAEPVSQAQFGSID